MAQLLLIKMIAHDDREVNDIVGFFEDIHKFSDDEKIFFNIQQVKGYSREAIAEFARYKRPETRRIYKSKKANVWTLARPEEETAWIKDNKWYMLAEEPKYMFTIKNMTEQEKIIIADKEATIFDRLNALAHLECKIAMNPKNMAEIPELTELIQ